MGEGVKVMITVINMKVVTKEVKSDRLVTNNLPLHKIIFFGRFRNFSAVYCS